MAKHETVDVPWSRLKEDIVKVLVEEGYVRQIRRFQVEGQVQDTLRIHLKYDRNRQPVLGELKRVSRPGRRVYLGYRDIHPVRKGLGTHILSTPKGIVADREASRPRSAASCCVQSARGGFVSRVGKLPIVVPETVKVPWRARKYGFRAPRGRCRTTSRGTSMWTWMVACFMSAGTRRPSR